MTKIVGLTGGIGSGKTTVTKIFNDFGIPTYIADDAAKEVMQSEGILSALRATFGDQVFHENVLDRKLLAAIVFSNPDKLRQLNAIVHPAVAQHFENWLRQHQHYPVVIYEAAILFESGGDKKCDVVITVTAPEPLKLERLQKRDATTLAAIQQRMAAQWTDQERIAKSDYVIENIDYLDTKAQVVKILKFL